MTVGKRMSSLAAFTQSHAHEYAIMYNFSKPDEGIESHYLLSWPSFTQVATASY